MVCRLIHGAAVLLSNTPSNRLISRFAMPDLTANVRQSLTAAATSSIMLPATFGAI